MSVDLCSVYRALGALMISLCYSMHVMAVCALIGTFASVYNVSTAFHDGHRFERASWLCVRSNEFCLSSGQEKKPHHLAIVRVRSRSMRSTWMMLRFGGTRNTPPHST